MSASDVAVHTNASESHANWLLGAALNAVQTLFASVRPAEPLTPFVVFEIDVHVDISELALRFAPLLCNSAIKLFAFPRFTAPVPSLFLKELKNMKAVFVAATSEGSLSLPYGQ